MEEVVKSIFSSEVDGVKVEDWKIKIKYSDHLNKKDLKSVLKAEENSQNLRPAEIHDPHEAEPGLTGGSTFNSTHLKQHL